jgi:SagB-type dehydrogenase family enzyme
VTHSAHYEKYHLASSMPGFTLRPENWSSPADWPAAWSRIDYKSYPRAQRIDVPPAPECEDVGLTAALRQRRSGRERGKETPGLGTTIALLRAGAGVIDTGDPGDHGSRRAYPSGGARFPVETYLRMHQVDDAADGLYHYGLVSGELSLLSTSPEDDALFRRTFGFDWIGDAAATVLFSTVLHRSAMKYGERAYRFSLIEAGHLAQNVLLNAAARGLAATPVGGFCDHLGDTYLDFVYTDEHLIYAVVLP